jgi:hypothetical protein
LGPQNYFGSRLTGSAFFKSCFDNSTISFRRFNRSHKNCDERMAFGGQPGMDIPWLWALFLQYGQPKRCFPRLLDCDFKLTDKVRSGVRGLRFSYIGAD